MNLSWPYGCAVGAPGNKAVEGQRQTVGSMSAYDCFMVAMSPSWFRASSCALAGGDVVAIHSFEHRHAERSPFAPVLARFPNPIQNENERARECTRGEANGKEHKEACRCSVVLTQTVQPLLLG
jgi:hypothetical protein